MTEKEIINLLQEDRHEEAFNRIIETYSEKIYWHVRRFLCCHEDADDLVQEIFLKVWTALLTFRGESSLFTWIYRIATNEVLNHLRKQKFKAIVSLESEEKMLCRKIDEDPYFNGTALQRELYKSIQKLPHKQRIVFNMRYFDEMKYEDISEITGTSVGALKASYHHAYNKIKQDLLNL